MASFLFQNHRKPNPIFSLQCIYADKIKIKLAILVKNVPSMRCAFSRLWLVFRSQKLSKFCLLSISFLNSDANQGNVQEDSVFGIQILLC